MRRWHAGGVLRRAGSRIWPGSGLPGFGDPQPVADVQKAGCVVERVQIEHDSPLLSSGGISASLLLDFARAPVGISVLTQPLACLSTS